MFMYMQVSYLYMSGFTGLFHGIERLFSQVLNLQYFVEICKKHSLKVIYVEAYYIN